VFDDAFCFLVPPRPLSGILDPAAEEAAALARDHAFARRFAASLMRASPLPVVTLAPSHPFDASRMRVIEPKLLRILTSVLHFYAEVWRAAREVVIHGRAATLPPFALEPLRSACDPAVLLFVFTGEDGRLAAAGYLSLLTGRVLAIWPPVD